MMPPARGTAALQLLAADALLALAGPPVRQTETRRALAVPVPHEQAVRIRGAAALDGLGARRGFPLAR